MGARVKELTDTGRGGGMAEIMTGDEEDDEVVRDGMKTGKPRGIQRYLSIHWTL